jgi:hypothetical protein
VYPKLQRIGVQRFFCPNYYEIVEKIKLNEDVPIEVTFFLDSICTSCPNNLGNKCRTESKINSLDKNHAEILQLKEGENITWKGAKNRIKSYMTAEKFHQACVLVANGRAWEYMKKPYKIY